MYYPAFQSRLAEISAEQRGVLSPWTRGSSAPAHQVHTDRLLLTRSVYSASLGITLPLELVYIPERR